MRKIFQIILIICGGLLMNSCYYDEVEIIVEEVPDISDTVYFAADIQPIFTKNCIGCHNANRDPDLREDYSHSSLVPKYVKAGDPETSRLYNYLPGFEHHDVSVSLSVIEKGLIQAWIKQGALNN